MPPNLHPLLDLSRRPVVGHRGNSAHAPENTQESFRQAIALGVEAIEFDVRLTRDGEVVVIHDPTVDRTTDGTGMVADLSLAQLRALDAGARFTRTDGNTFPYRGRGVGITTLEEVLRAFPDTPALIEIKTADAAATTRRVIERVGAVARCIVASFQAAALVPFRGSGIAVGSTPGDVKRMYFPALFGWRYRTRPFQTMSLPAVYNDVIPLPLGSLARAVRPAGVTINVWTVNDAGDARRLWAKGVCGILSDDPGRILEARRELESGGR